MRSDDLDQREVLLKRDGMLIGIAAASLVNGMHFSPLFEPAFLLLRAFAPSFLSGSPLLMFYFTSLLLSATTLILTGVPAALFERFTGRKQSDTTSLTIWLVTGAALAIVTLVNRG
jgi:hypothetical protein